MEIEQEKPIPQLVEGAVAKSTMPRERSLEILNLGPPVYRMHFAGPTSVKKREILPPPNSTVDMGRRNEYPFPKVRLGLYRRDACLDDGTVGGVGGQGACDWGIRVDFHIPPKGMNW